jgi:hypothetical protein
MHHGLQMQAGPFLLEISGTSSGRTSECHFDTGLFGLFCNFRVTKRVASPAHCPGLPSLTTAQRDVLRHLSSPSQWQSVSFCAEARFAVNLTCLPHVGRQACFAQRQNSQQPDIFCTSSFFHVSRSPGSSFHALLQGVQVCHRGGGDAHGGPEQ